MMTATSRLISRTQCQLGEGPLWLPGENALYYVDIKGGAIHRYHPASDESKTFPVGGSPSFIVPAQGARLLVGSGDGLFLLEGGQLGERVATIDMPTHNRTNDGTVDGHGRLWFGTMDDQEQNPTGAVYCFADGTVREMGGSAVVTNGPAISADGRTLYHVNSGERMIWRYTIGAGPTLSEPELFLQLSEEDGYPDGVILDSEGCLWVALWDGWGVQRYSPEGELLMRVDLPCGRATKIALGGDDLRTAYVTTARIGLSEAELAEQPLAGGLFAFDAPAPGLPLPVVKL